MKPPPPPAGRHWHPLGSQYLYDVPPVGALVAWRHTVWQVVEIRERPEDLWDDADRKAVAHYTPTAREKWKPRVLTLRPASIGADDLKRVGQVCHVGIGGRWNYAASLSPYIYLFPDDHYPV